MDEKEQFVEEIGHFFERSGLTRMAGRILGWLLICEPPHQSMKELAQALHASKGSISSMTRMLIRLGLVERFSFPGERRDYFRIRPDAWQYLMDTKLTELRHMREMAERGLALLEEKDSDVRHRLSGLHDIAIFLEREFPALVERWQRERDHS
ncbi:MAG: MarR family transcriptional regulator [Anaerolineae bacterium]|nr:MarR family transcriptional regulator [Anaerolineae bacterium]